MMQCFGKIILFSGSITNFVVSMMSEFELLQLLSFQNDSYNFVMKIIENFWCMQIKKKIKSGIYQQLNENLHFSFSNLFQNEKDIIMSGCGSYKKQTNNQIKNQTKASNSQLSGYR